MATAPTPAPTTPRTGLTMRAFVLRRVNEVGIVDKPIPEPGPNAAVVLTTAALICTSDVHTAKGVIPLPPDRTLGHEAVGRVWRLGSEVTGFGEGDRVLVNAITPCFQCSFCQRGFPSQCQGMLGGYKFTGQKDGSLAELSEGKTWAALRRRVRRYDAARSVPGVTGADRSWGVASARAFAVRAFDAVGPGWSSGRTE